MKIPEFARKDLMRLITFSVPITVIVFLLSIPIIGFEIYFPIGLIIGFILMLLNFCLTALFLSEIKNYKEKAPSRITISYILRYLLMGLVFTGAAFIDLHMAFAVGIELMFPKLIFTIYGTIKKGE